MDDPQMPVMVIEETTGGLCPFMVLANRPNDDPLARRVPRKLVAKFPDRDAAAWYIEMCRTGRGPGRAHPA